ncbi:hypothetical protein G6549_25615 [Bacillus sp. MM2020_1]|nr:hypothetical protein [Bacillus sp. MM2020_1]
MHTQPITDVEFIKQIQRLQKNIQIYEELADKIRNAAVMDRSIYSDEQDSDWLSINREDYAQIMEVLSKLDLWKPWNQTIQPRIMK